MISNFITRKYLAVSPDETISSLLGKCRKAKHFYAVVVDKNGRCKGVVDKRKLLKLNVDASKTKISKLVVSVPTLTEEMDEVEAMRLFFTADVHMLPVLHKNSVIGIVKVIDLLVSQKSRLRGVKVQELAKDSLTLLNENDPISKAVSMFKSKGIGRLPIVNSNGNLLGISTVEDILYQYHLFPTRKGSTERSKSGRSNPTSEDSKNQVPIGNLMGSTLWTLKSNDSATRIVDLFQEQSIGSVVVVSGNKPVGIVAVKDVLRFLQ